MLQWFSVPDMVISFDNVQSSTLLNGVMEISSITGGSCSGEK
jgi:hypothetical protein